MKRAKLHVYKGQFEGLKMEKDEKIEDYFLWINEVINIVRGLGETIDDLGIVNKVLRTLPKRFDPKVPALEEKKDIDFITMYELHKILTTYKMRKK